MFRSVTKDSHALRAYLRMGNATAFFRAFSVFMFFCTPQHAHVICYCEVASRNAPSGQMRWQKNPANHTAFVKCCKASNPW